jgi:PAS domain S-box-containing protein
MPSPGIRSEKIKTQALQDAILQSASFSSIATDEKGVIQIFNVGAERMLGYAASDVIDQITPADISNPKELIARAAELSQELGTPIAPGFEALVFKASRGIEDIYELTYTRKDGSHFPAVVSVTALRDAKERIIGYLLIGTDNTARHEVEAVQAQLDELLRDQQFYSHSLIESSIDALMMTDELGIISDVNNEMMSLTGRTRAELLGTHCKEFFTDPDLAATAIERVLTENRVNNYELTVRAKNGQETLVSYNAATFHDRNDKLQGVFAAARDITERQRFEQALLESNLELEHASKMKSEFLATMSHELRTPLNAIIGFSEALKDGLVGEMTDSQREYTGDIFTSGQHLLSLINDILDLSKVEAGMMTLELESANLGDLLAGSLSIVKETAVGQGVRLELEMDEDIGIFELDLRKTKQIMYNLLSNAVKFSGQDGVVTLSARRVTRESVGLIAGGWPVRAFPLPESQFIEFVSLTIRDTGIGISIESMAKLFQAFSQIDSSLARKFEGTGLGLAMVKRLAELHGGTVAVASAEGEGSCFTVWLPIRAVKSAAEQLQQNREPPNSNVPLGLATAPFITRTVLVVDDDPKAVEAIATFLPVSEYTVVRAYGGGEAIALAERLRPDLILLDLVMPDISGLVVFDSLQRTRVTADIPIIIVTAKSITAQDRAQLVSASGMAIEIFEKFSLDRDAFLAGVRRALREPAMRH